ncbi:Calx-beta domain-containing protein [Marinobacter sp. SS21]|uniref:Calx-beta domain-containing protein n=1 Tax=Marinobacter sp. SS21 TaxID=2979460 RepID=UPI00232B664A|nr:hypothetical protein [Marinobacter sp. SS21]MDC0663344.1 hypothetical protein [Marinobacter sp. SS21]
MSVVSYRRRFSRPVSLLLVGAAILGLSACKTKKDADDPTVLGIPPSTAYLGVEYSYNFGADGGDGILDYSLTNAPSWLGLEDISNKARQGIILRGVPGITGGQRGADDLGKTSDVVLLTTDGDRVGLQPFDVEVVNNELSLAASDATEGAAGENIDDGGEAACVPPAMEGNGEHTYTLNGYDDAGNVVETIERTSPTAPLLVTVRLDQPSVTRVSVAFQLTSQYDPSNCDGGATPPHQQCDNSGGNSVKAAIGRDVVGLGSNSASDLVVPDYLQYQADGDGYFAGGLLTFEPGITECYIRLEVVDDTIAEQPESFALALTEVREGLASISEATSEGEVGIEITDDEPRATLETPLGLGRDSLNARAVDPDIDPIPEYLVRLSGDRSGDYRVYLSTAGSSAVADSDFEIEVLNSAGDWIARDWVSIADDVDTARFRLRVLDTFANALDEDKQVKLTVDTDFQAGRERVAGSTGSTLRIGLNELVAEVLVGSDGGFVPTDMAIGHDGRHFIVGYDSASNLPQLRILDRLGVDSLGPVALPDAPVDPSAPPVINYVQKPLSNDSFDRRLVISYGTAGAITGATNAGAIDLVTALYQYDSAAVPAGYVLVWETQSGSAGDDVPSWVGLDATFNVFITGETSGVLSSDGAAGGVDSFAQRIDTRQDGGASTATVAWTRQAGSGLDETVSGGDLAPSGVVTVGTSRGGVQGQTQFGGRDFFFYDASSPVGSLAVRQRGTEADDSVVAVRYDDNGVWLAGQSPSVYAAEPNDDSALQGALELTSAPASSVSAFLFRYAISGQLNRVVMLNDSDDTANEQVTALASFDDDLVVAGSSDGLFAPDADNAANRRQPILARIDGGHEADAADAVIWRAQGVIDDARVIRLGQYRNDELAALVEVGGSGSRQWQLLVFSGAGRQLN